MTTPTAVSQSRSFYTVFFIEMWERFGYYGMQALIVYYLVERLHFSDTRASLTWGAAAALIYVSPTIGGWIGDRILGSRHSMLTGAMVLAFGYALMAIPGSNIWLLYCALGVIVVGNGLFKPNAGNLVRKIYEGEDSRLDSAFTIYYMAVNIGSTVSMLLTPWIKDYVKAAWGQNFGWHAAFAVCCFGLLVGLGNYLVMRHTLAHIGSEPDHRPLDPRKLAAVLGLGAIAVFVSAVVLNYALVARIAVYLAAVVVFGIFIYLIRRGQQDERPGMIAALILTIQTVFFFIFWQQMSTSLNLFALRNVDWSFNLFGLHLWEWKPAQFQALDPIWVMILSPVLAFAYTQLGKRGQDLSIAGKFALGFAMVAAGYFVYGAAAHFLHAPGKTSSWIMVWGYGLTSLGELLISGLGLAMIARYVPARMGGFMMGAYYVALGIAMYFGSLVATVASVPSTLTDPVETLPIYTRLFNWLGIAGVACTLIALAVLPFMRKLTAEHRKAAEG